MDTPDDDRLTLLERAQLLHDATLRRHGEMLDAQEDSRLRHEAQMGKHEEEIAQLKAMLEQQIHNHALLTEIAARLETTLQAIKDLLERRNGHQGNP